MGVPSRVRQGAGKGVERGWFLLCEIIPVLQRTGRTDEVALCCRGTGCALRWDLSMRNEIVMLRLDEKMGYFVVRGGWVEVNSTVLRKGCGLMVFRFWLRYERLCHCMYYRLKKVFLKLGCFALMIWKM